MENNTSVKKECRDKLIEALQRNLDTRDKRFMFLKICFPTLIPRIQIEGNSQDTSWNIYSEFEKQGMIGSLTACLNSYFNEDLYLFHENK